MLYLSHVLQGSKPSTSSGPVEKVNIEPPTANIKPMAGPSSTQSKQQPVSSHSYVPSVNFIIVHQNFNQSGPFITESCQLFLLLFNVPHVSLMSMCLQSHI
jgi:hypothetical protein